MIYEPSNNLLMNEYCTIALFAAFCLTDLVSERVSEWVSWEASFQTTTIWRFAIAFNRHLTSHAAIPPSCTETS